MKKNKEPSKNSFKNVYFLLEWFKLQAKLFFKIKL